MHQVFTLKAISAQHVVNHYSTSETQGVASFGLEEGSLGHRENIYLIKKFINVGLDFVNFTLKLTTIQRKSLSARVVIS